LNDSNQSTKDVNLKAPTDVDVKLVVREAPDAVAIERQFKIICKLENFSSSKMEVKLFLTSAASSLLWCGVSGKLLGPLPPNSTLDFELHGIFTRSGLHNVGGVQILDTNSTKMFDFNDIFQILVHSTDQLPFQP